MLFCVLGVTLGYVITTAYVLLVNIAFLAVTLITRRAEVDTAKLAGVFVGALIVLAIYFAAMLAMVVVGAIIGSFINAGLTHLCLMIVGGAEQPFETTYRVVCYTLGACAMCQVLPLVGPLIGGVANIVVAIIGLYAGHETTGGKAAGAVFLPILVLCGLLFILWLVLFGLVAGLTHMAPPRGV
jgi:hypothetical protein